jgi:RNA polymerase sigma-70 factor (ECF subfamily)
MQRESRTLAEDERQLILASKGGSHEAFRVLVERHMKQAYDVAYGLLNDHDDAEDVAQEAFVRAYRSLRNFREEAGFGTWLYRIVHNVSLNRVRQKKVRQSREMNPDHRAAASEARTHSYSETVDTRAHIERALHQLPTLQRSVVILRHLEGMSTQQASRILGCSEGTVKTHLHRGLKKMKRLLEHLNDQQ